MKKVNCIHCIYYSVTWDPKFPKGCKFLNFKSANMPSVTVFESTGNECEAFIAKEIRKEKNENKNGKQVYL